MFKTISAALLAASVLAAPAFAATTKTTQVPVSKTTTQTEATPAATTPAKGSAVNTKKSKHHRKVVRHYQRHAKPAHNAKVSVKRAAPTTTKRG
ncbi:MAG TPA: hypothetical protein VKR55_11120 [Bradyrhizobium sp.]|uniref:His-rich protein BRANT n=1 Tax=Bradyrhizobium sp. TaxID=376 RepID=UPI002C149A63|nr:hypothetical protein [Bradyrhizobium sp.]HLZ02688.1 hypothetical protein [Bradyrhizobium sp.]